jgi:hypothetical protein
MIKHAVAKAAARARTAAGRAGTHSAGRWRGTTHNDDAAGVSTWRVRRELDVADGELDAVAVLGHVEAARAHLLHRVQARVQRRDVDPRLELQLALQTPLELDVQVRVGDAPHQQVPDIRGAKRQLHAPTHAGDTLA